LGDVFRLLAGKPARATLGAILDLDCAAPGLAAAIDPVADDSFTSWRARAERGMRGIPLKTRPDVLHPAQPLRSFEARRARAGRKSGLTAFRKPGAKRRAAGESAPAEMAEP
jgi:hypothetical protein